MTTKINKIMMLFSIAFCILINTSCAQTDTSGMTQKEKIQEEKYQESVETDANRRVEIPFNSLPEAITTDLNDRYRNPVLVKAWREVDEEGVVQGYTVRVGDSQADNKEYVIHYDQEGNPSKRERLKNMKERSPNPDTQ